VACAEYAGCRRSRTKASACDSAQRLGAPRPVRGQRPRHGVGASRWNRLALAAQIGNLRIVRYESAARSYDGGIRVGWVPCAGRGESSWLRAKIPRGTVHRGDPSVPRNALEARSVFMRAPPTRLAPPGPRRHTGRGSRRRRLLRIARSARLRILRVAVRCTWPTFSMSAVLPMCAERASSRRRDGSGGGGRVGARGDPAVTMRQTCFECVRMS